MTTMGVKGVDFIQLFAYRTLSLIRVLIDSVQVLRADATEARVSGSN